MREKVAARGAAARAADMVLGLYVAARNGEFTQANPTLTTVLGRASMMLKALMSSRVEG